MNIKILVMDVDGTMTDGKIYIDSKGESFKAFNVKDGFGISKLHEFNIIPIILTGRYSDIVLKRAEELKIKYVYQGEKNKYQKLLSIIKNFNVSLSEVAYIGDDENDLECIEKCGLSGCPRDAIEEVKQKSSFVCTKNGGGGVIREFIEEIIKLKHIL